MEVGIELSFFLAKVCGFFLVIVSCTVLLNRRHLSRIIEEFHRSLALTLFSGIITLVLGLLVVVSHNIWSADWRTIITILGWLTLLKGIFLFLLPHKMSGLASIWWGEKLTVKVIIMLASYIALGAYLTYVGFSAQVG